jgi:hypothetical protein
MNALPIDVATLVAELALQYWTPANTPDLSGVIAAVTGQLPRLGSVINSTVIAFAQTQVAAVFAAEEATEEAHGGPAVVIPPSGNTPSLADVRAYYSTASAQVLTAGTIIDFNIVETDTDSAVTTGANWRFTCPTDKGGTYLVSCVLLTNTTASFQVYLNGSPYKRISTNTATTFGSASIPVDLVPGDFIDIRSTTDATLIILADSNWVRIVSN